MRYGCILILQLGVPLTYRSRTCTTMAMTGPTLGKNWGPTSLQRVETPEAMDGWKLEYSFPFGALNGLFFGGRNGC